MKFIHDHAPQLLLAFLLVLFVANPIARAAAVPGIAYIIDGLLFVVLITGVYAERGRISWKRIGPWTVVAAFILRLIGIRWHQRFEDWGNIETFLIVSEVFTAIVIFRICYLLVRRLTAGGRVRSNTVAGIAAVYILMAIAFGSLHIATYAAQGPEAFKGIQDLPQNLDTDESGLTKWGPEFMYYSVVTQSTLGYGDITPQTDVAKGLAIAQTVIGQLYLAIILARIVGMELAQRGTGGEE